MSDPRSRRSTGVRPGDDRLSQILAELDAILEVLEADHLRDRMDCPPAHWAAVRRVQQELLPLSAGLPETPGTTAEAIEAVFSIQEILLRLRTERIR